MICEMATLTIEVSSSSIMAASVTVKAIQLRLR